MGEYTELARQYAKSLKPKIERKTGKSLEGLAILPATEEMLMLEELKCAALFVLPGSERAVYVNEGLLERLAADKVDEKALKEYALPSATAHEISHLMHVEILNSRQEKERGMLDKLLDDYEQSEGKIPEHARKKIERKARDKARLVISLAKESAKAQGNTPFMEGFAEYMCLDYLSSIYSPEVQQNCGRIRESYMAYEGEDRDSVKGYRFFRKVLDIIGKERVFEVAMNPPTKKELEKPEIYAWKYLNAKPKTQGGS